MTHQPYLQVQPTRAITIHYTLINKQHTKSNYIQYDNVFQLMRLLTILLMCHFVDQIMVLLLEQRWVLYLTTTRDPCPLEMSERLEQPWVPYL